MADNKIAQRPKFRNDLTAEYVRSLFDYDRDTGILTWRRRADRNASWNAKFAGKRAGRPNTMGYWQVGINGHLYLVPRLAWLIEKGEWPLEIIDHKNLKKGEDNFDNLRNATWGGNQHNKAKTKRNTSGYKGVYWHKTQGKWIAAIGVRGRLIHLGTFDDKELARASYNAAAVQYHGEFARQNA